VEHRGELIFLYLVLDQGAHSIEEYVTKLYEVFARVRFVSNDLPLGFLFVNAALVTFGVWCWAVPVRGTSANNLRASCLILKRSSPQVDGLSPCRRSDHIASRWPLSPESRPTRKLCRSEAYWATCRAEEGANAPFLFHQISFDFLSTHFCLRFAIVNSHDRSTAVFRPIVIRPTT